MAETTIVKRFDHGRHSYIDSQKIPRYKPEYLAALRRSFECGMLNDEMAIFVQRHCGIRSEQPLPGENVTFDAPGGKAVAWGRQVHNGVVIREAYYPPEFASRRSGVIGRPASWLNS
jgi:hypothetical protein